MVRSLGMLLAALGLIPSRLVRSGDHRRSRRTVIGLILVIAAGLAACAERERAGLIAGVPTAEWSTTSSEIPSSVLGLAPEDGSVDREDSGTSSVGPEADPDPAGVDAGSIGFTDLPDEPGAGDVTGADPVDADGGSTVTGAAPSSSATAPATPSSAPSTPSSADGAAPGGSSTTSVVTGSEEPAATPETPPRSTANTDVPLYRGVLGTLGHDQVVAPATSPPPPPVGPGFSPLTGLPSGHTDRPAIVAKIDNANWAARPQSGLNAADLVIEERVEGSVTRLAAVFHSTSSSIGPIRSARSSDIAILGSFNRPIFAWSGSNRVFVELIRRQEIVDRGANSFGGYRRAPGRRAPHNLYTSTDQLWAGVDGEPPATQFSFRRPDQALPETAVPASSVRLDFNVDYTWDASSGGWLRRQSGTRHIDAAGVQVAPTTVIVQFVGHVASGLHDSSGAVVPEAVSVGQGRGWIFSEGHLIDAHWTKSSIGSVTTWTDEDGAPIAILPGRTWIELIEPGGASWS